MSQPSLCVSGVGVAVKEGCGGFCPLTVSSRIPGLFQSVRNVRFELHMLADKTPSSPGNPLLEKEDTGLIGRLGLAELKVHPPGGQSIAGALAGGSPPPQASHLTLNLSI